MGRLHKMKLLGIEIDFVGYPALGVYALLSVVALYGASSYFGETTEMMVMEEVNGRVQPVMGEDGKPKMTSYNSLFSRFSSLEEQRRSTPSSTPIRQNSDASSMPTG